MNWITIIIILIIVCNIWYYGTGQDKIDAAKKAEEERKKIEAQEKERRRREGEINKTKGLDEDGYLKLNQPFVIHFSDGDDVAFIFTSAYIKHDWTYELYIEFICENRGKSKFTIWYADFSASIDDYSTPVHVSCPTVEPGKKGKGRIGFTLEKNSKLKSYYDVEMKMYKIKYKINLDNMDIYSA